MTTLDARWLAHPDGWHDPLDALGRERYERQQRAGSDDESEG